MEAKTHTFGILGGAGFIGSRLAARLVASGHRVKIGDLRTGTVPGAEYAKCDVTDRESVQAFARDTDVLFNLAAEHRDDVRPLERYHDVNVNGAENVCAAADISGVRKLIFTSSVAVYGIPEGSATEEAPCRPFNEYGRTKLLAEHVFRAWADADPERTLVVVRPTVVFGEGNRGNVYNLASQIAAGRFLMVGDGRNRKSMAYVENVAAFLVHVTSLQNGTHTFNYADGPDLDMNTLVRHMRQALGRRSGSTLRVPYSLGMLLGRTADAISKYSGRALPISSVRVKKFCANTRISADKAREIGFAPAVPLESAIERFLTTDFPPARG